MPRCNVVTHLQKFLNIILCIERLFWERQFGQFEITSIGITSVGFRDTVVYKGFGSISRASSNCSSTTYVKLYISYVKSLFMWPDSDSEQIRRCPTDSDDLKTAHKKSAIDVDRQLPPENSSLVEVKCFVIESEQTRVELTQSNWKAFGDMAEMRRNGYGSGWVLIFE